MYINKLPILLLILYVNRIGELKVFHIAVVSSLQTLDLQHRDFDSMSVRRVAQISLFPFTCRCYGFFRKRVAEC